MLNFEREKLTGSEFNQKYRYNLYTLDVSHKKFQFFSDNLGILVNQNTLAFPAHNLPRFLSSDTVHALRIHVPPDSNVTVQKSFFKISGFIPLEVLDIEDLPHWNVEPFQRNAIKLRWCSVYFIPDPSEDLVEYANSKWRNNTHKFPAPFRINLYPELD